MAYLRKTSKLTKGDELVRPFHGIEILTIELQKLLLKSVHITECKVLRIAFLYNR